MKLSAFCVMGAIMMAGNAVATTGSAYSGSYGYACTHNPNSSVMLCSGSSQNYNVLVRMSNGSDIRVIDSQTSRDHEWCKIRYGCTTSWARADYICS